MRYFLVMCMTAFLLFSCTKEQEQQAPLPAPPQKSLFEQVRDKTVENPNDAEAWYHLADLYGRAGAYREEINALNKVLEINPEKTYAYAKLGTAYNRLGQYEDAAKNLRTATKHFPKNAMLHNNLAAAYGNIGKRAEQIASLKKAVSLRPRYSTARYNLGIVMLRQGNVKAALGQYHELKKFDVGVAEQLKKEIDAHGK